MPRAAQYLRMSTEHQRYSLENQAAAIALYALSHGYEVVRSYVDAGKSGLTLSGRQGLKDLLSDVVGGNADFTEVLVLDVSRWGRFQDPDQAAHYEFICREAGLTVRYCGETFENDGSLAASVMKQIKRVMAAEYSRELGVRVGRAKRHVAGLGLRTGGNLNYGFRRLLLDEHGRPRAVLQAGQRKVVQTDRVVLAHGPPEEIAAVRRVFRLYLRGKKRFRQIADAMARSGAPPPGGGWTDETVRSIIKSEIYTGVQVYGRTAKPLRGRTIRNPETEWIRAAVVEPMVSAATFEQAQALRASRHKRLTDEELLAQLRCVLVEEGDLLERLLAGRPGLPNKTTFARRFGSYSRAFRLVGHEPRPHARSWTNEGLLGELQGLHALHGFVSERLVRTAPHGPCLRTYRRHFGSLASAANAAGLERPSAEPVCKSGRRWSVEPLLEHLHRLQREYGRVTWEIISDDPKAPSPKTYKRWFGSVEVALRVAGIDPYVRVRPRGRRWTNEALLEQLARLQREHERVTCHVVTADPSTPTAKTYTRRFGTLAAAGRLAEAKSSAPPPASLEVPQPEES